MPSTDTPKRPRTIYDDGSTKITDTQARRGCSIALVVIVGLILFIGLLKSFNTIDAGDEGAVICFGTVSGTLDPGVHIVAPWCGVSGMDARTQTYAMVAAAKEGAVEGDDSLAVQSNDQVPLGVNAAVIYHLDRTKAGEIYARYKSPDALTVVLRNVARRAIHDSGARFAALDLTGGKRGEFGADAEKALTPALAEYGIVLERVEVRDVTPVSQSYIDSIASKVAAQQRAQAKEYELAAAEKDKQIKATNAEGDANAQAIRNSQRPAPELLQQQYIDAMKTTQNRVIITDGKTPVFVTPPAG